MNAASSGKRPLRKSPADTTEPLVLAATPIPVQHWCRRMTRGVGTRGYLLAYAMPLRKIYLTGQRPWGMQQRYLSFALFADSIRVEGLRLLAKHRIEEGVSACVNYTRGQNLWASQKRTPALMKILLIYGTHGKAVIPELKEMARYFEEEEKNFPKEMMLMKAKCVRETIRAIESSTDSPELSRLK